MVCLADQYLGRDAVFRVTRDTDAGIAGYLPFFKGPCSFETLVYEIDQAPDVIFRDGTVDQGDEFISSMPVHPVFQHRDAVEEFAQLDKEFIAGIMAVMIIDGLESIQVEEKKICFRVVPHMPDHAIAVIDQFSPVGQAGQ